MTTVAQFLYQFNNGFFALNTPLTEIRYIGPYIGRRARQQYNWTTIGDVARWARNKTTAEVHEGLSQVARNRRANRCVDYGVAGGPQNNQVVNDYHVPVLNTRGYNTLRNLIDAARQHWAIFHRIPAQLPPVLTARDLGSQICSCITTRNQCRQLAQQQVCTWRDRRCKPRETSRAAAFRGAADLAGQHTSQGRRVAGMRFRNRWRVPDNR